MCKAHQNGDTVLIFRPEVRNVINNHTVIADCVLFIVLLTSERFLFVPILLEMNNASQNDLSKPFIQIRDKKVINKHTNGIRTVFVLLLSFSAQSGVTLQP